MQELYGTFLTYRVYDELKRSPCSLRMLAARIGPEYEGRELHNLKCRIRHSLNRLIDLGEVSSEWQMDGNNAYKQYSIYEPENASKTDEPQGGYA